MYEIQQLREAVYKWLIGTIIVLLCCFTPILIILFGVFGLSAFTGYIDLVLFPVLFFVYVAAYQGGIVAKNITHQVKQRADLNTVPAVTFTNPSVAAVGLTEQQAKDQGYDVQVSVLPLEAVPRALANHDTKGIFKLVMNTENRQIMGVQIVSENAGDVIYAATLAVKFKLKAEDLQNTLAPYLTMAEGLKLASLTFDKDVSKLSCCAG